MKISVCIATYNGEAFIEQQLLSIINQIKAEDEIIVSDDSSNDNTLDIVNRLKTKNMRVYQNNKFANPIYNFENALNFATGDIIFLADQDDIWEKNKVKVMTEYLEKYDVVVSDATLINASGAVTGESFYKLRKSGAGVIKNLYRNTYLGCTMAINRRILERALPFPLDIPMHDMWLGLVGEMFGKTIFINDKLVQYRRHSHTVTTGKHAAISQMLYWRFSLFKNLFLRYFAGQKVIN